MSGGLTDKIEFVTLCVNLFAERHALSRRDACRYLYQYNGLAFLDEFYLEESTLSEENVVEDLDQVCRNYGGIPTW